MLTKQQWDLGVSNLGEKLFKLYWDDGVISLNNLNDFRAILKDMDVSMQTLFKALRTPFPTKHLAAQKEVMQLENQYRVFEYNISLCEPCAA